MFFVHLLFFQPPQNNRNSTFWQVYEIMFIMYNTVRNSDTGGVSVSRWGRGHRVSWVLSGSTSNEQEQQWYSNLRPTGEGTDVADGCYRGSGRGLSCDSLMDGCERQSGTSAQFTPGTSMFASTRAQESFQSQLHKGLEIIASLPSALLWMGDRYVDRNHMKSVIKSNYSSMSDRNESNFLSRCCQEVLSFIPSSLPHWMLTVYNNTIICQSKLITLV